MIKKCLKVLLVASFFSVFNTESAQAEMLGDNVDSTNGGVNVTPLGAFCVTDSDIKDKKVVFSYEVSLNAILSEDHLLTGNSFTFTVPDVVEDVNFTLIGTQDQKEGTLDEGNHPVDVNIPLGKETKENYYIGDFDHSIPSYKNLQKLLSTGQQVIPNAVLDFEGLSESYGGEDSGLKVKQYGIVSNLSKPVGIKVDYIVDYEQAIKTPYLPLDVRLSWKSPIMTNSFASFETGSEILDHYRGEKNRFLYVSSPDLIKKGDFDYNGLHTSGGIAVTKNTGHWSRIGRDVSPGWNFVDQFMKNDITTRYVAPAYEDVADIAVSEYTNDCPTDSTSTDSTSTDSTSTDSTSTDSTSTDSTSTDSTSTDSTSTDSTSTDSTSTDSTSTDSTSTDSTSTDSTSTDSTSTDSTSTDSTSTDSTSTDSTSTDSTSTDSTSTDSTSTKSRNMVINYPNSSSDNNSKRYDKSASKLLPSTGEEKMGSLIVIGIIIIFIAYLLFRVRKSQK